MAVTGQDLPGLRKPTTSARQSQCRAEPVLGRSVGTRPPLRRPARSSALLALTVFSSLTWRIIALNLAGAGGAGDRHRLSSTSGAPA